MTGAVVVWGNCQAPALAGLLRAPLAAHGLVVLDVPPVFEVDDAGLQRIRTALRTAAVLVTQPVSDEYRTPGCGSQQLAAVLPDHGRLVTMASAYHVGPFPYLVNAHDAAGRRVDAPLTDYHDLRTVAQALDRSLPPLTAAGVRALDAASRSELRRREAGLDVGVSAAATAPGAMHVFNHPAAATLCSVAAAVLQQLGVPAAVLTPDREPLGAIRAPIDAVTADALGWPRRARWSVGGHDLDPAAVTAAHLELYRQRPDVAADAWNRHQERLRLLAS
jgi:hypothetical protein